MLLAEIDFIYPSDHYQGTKWCLTKINGLIIFRYLIIINILSIINDYLMGHKR